MPWRLARAGIFAAAWLLGMCQAQAQVTITLSCSSLGIEMQLCRSGAEAWARQTGNKVKLVPTPADANQRLALYQSLLAAHSSAIDVFQIDVVWPGTLASQLIDLRPYFSKQELADYFKVLIDNDTVHGALVAIPWFVDAGLLYYRKDLLDRYGRSVPQTWEQLTATAKDIVTAERAKGDTGMQGYVFQGRAYEGLTCNALEWIASFGGGTIINANGEVTVDNPRAAKALVLARSWIGTIAPEGVLNYAEEEARGVFQSGHAVFMRNWPYAWALANAADSPVRGKVGIAVLPRGRGGTSRHAAVLGGQQLAVSRYSKHPAVAADLVRYLTSAAEQKRRALKGAFNPTRRSLYSDPELVVGNPFLAKFRAVLESAVARPSSVTGTSYPRVSNAFMQAVHDTLAGQGSAADNLAALASRLNRLKLREGW